MPIYRVFIDGVDIGEEVKGNTFADAYFDVASSHPITYKNDIVLKEVESVKNL